MTLIERLAPVPKNCARIATIADFLGCLLGTALVRRVFREALAGRRSLSSIWQSARRHSQAAVAVRIALLLLFVTLCGGALGDAKAQTPELVGRWATQGFGSIVEFRPCADDPKTFCGRILWLWEENDASGRPRTDRHNPDSELRNRSLVGIYIVRGLRETASGSWSGGELYNPDDGRTYSGEVRVKGEALELHGCALVVFCQTQTWRRPEDVIKAVRAAGQ